MKKKSNLILIALFSCIILCSSAITLEINFVNSYVEALVNNKDLDKFIEDSNKYNIHFKVNSAHIEDLYYDCSPFEAMCYYNPDLAIFMIDKGYVSDYNVEFEELYITLSSDEVNRFKLFNRLFNSFDENKLFLLSDSRLIDLIYISVCSSLSLDEEKLQLGNDITIKLLDYLSVDSKRFSEVLNTLMYNSIEKNNKLLLEYLYNNYDINLNQKTDIKFSNLETTFLTSAAKSGRYEILKWLVFNGADVNLKSNGKTAYEHCLENYNIKKDSLSVEFLEDYEKSLNYLKPLSLERGLDDIGGLISDFIKEK